MFCGHDRSHGFLQRNVVADMSARMSHIRFISPQSDEMVSRALRRVAALLDMADNGEDIATFSFLGEETVSLESRDAWMMACLLIADMRDASTPEILAIARGIEGIRQDALFT